LHKQENIYKEDQQRDDNNRRDREEKIAEYILERVTEDIHKKIRKRWNDCIKKARKSERKFDKRK
jgi:hypothetical protein